MIDIQNALNIMKSATSGGNFLSQEERSDMGAMKRLMALMVCIALLVSGFALADAPVNSAQGQEQIQDGAKPEAGEDDSEFAATTGDEDDVDDEADDSTDDSADESDPDADQSDSEQGKDGVLSETDNQDEDDDASDDDVDGSETLDGSNSSENSPEPDAANMDTKPDEDDTTDTTDTTDDTDDTDEPEDANAGINLFSANQKGAPVALDDIPCQHKGETKTEVWDEPTGVVVSENDEKHKVSVIRHWKTTCLDCGEVIAKGDDETSELYDHNFATLVTPAEGVFKCEECGLSIVCDHKGNLTKETKIEPDEGLENYVVAKDDHVHTIKALKYERDHCEKCDWRGDWELVGSITVENEAHEWDAENGGKVCLKCGYENKCTHEDWEYVGEWNDIYRATKINGDEHTAEYVRYADKQCKNCGLVFEHDVEIDRWTQTDEHWFDEYSDGSVGCLICGYVIPCTHPFVEYLVKEDVGWKEPEQVDAYQHRVRRYDQIHYRCRDCGHEWGWDYPDYEENKPVLEDHQWNDEGICKICGYKSECTQHEFVAVPDTERDGTVGYECVDALTHEVTLGVFQQYACKNCGFTIDKLVEGSENGPYVEEHYWTPEGVCAVCGVEGFCKHPAEYVEKLTGTVSRDDLDPIRSDDETHTMYADCYEQYHCTRCDAWWGYEVTAYGVEQTEPHVWDSDSASKCVLCGHANSCTHVGTLEDVKNVESRPIQSMTTATTHSLDTYVLEGKHCTNCGAYFGSKITEDTNEIVTEAHKFVSKDGKTVCEVCGYIRPAQKTSAGTTTSKENVDEFDAVADGVVLHGVTVGEPASMGVTLAKAMQGIAADYGADTQIAIRDIEKVLTAQECAALDALQPVDRILAVLGALGYSGEIDKALTGLNLTLSEDARADHFDKCARGDDERGRTGGISGGCREVLPGGGRPVDHAGDPRSRQGSAPGALHLYQSWRRMAICQAGGCRNLNMRTHWAGRGSGPMQRKTGRQ